MDNEKIYACKKNNSKIKESKDNSDSIRQETLNTISENSIENHKGSFCSKHPQSYRKNVLNNNQIEYNLNQRNFYRTPLVNTSGDKDGSSSESVELLNSDKKLNQKEKFMIYEEKSSIGEAVDASAPKKEKDENNCSSSYTIKSYIKSKPIWKFIHKFIEDNSEELLLLKDKYDTDDGFFTYLSELLIDKLSNETRLLKNLHRNTIKALPKVTIAIFLLYFQKIELVTGDYLEKKSGMVGHYKKLRVIADHLGLKLPFIMGDVVEKTLNEKKEDIFREMFFPSPKNVCRLDKRLVASKKMIKTISRWIQKTSDYKNLTDLRERLFEKNLPKPKDDDTRLVLFDKDKDKNSASLRNICDELIEDNSNINSYNDITRIIDTSVTTLMKKDYRRHMKYTNFMKLQNLYGKPINHHIFMRSYRSDKWIFLWQDYNGNKLSDNQTKARAGEYLIKEILKGNTSRYDIDYINNILKRNDFISALNDRGFTYNEILEEVNLELNVDPNKWETFNWDHRGNPRNYEEAFDNAVEYLEELISKNDYNFQLMDKPSQAHFNECHQDFMGALKRYKLNFYDILTEAGFQNDRFRKKWKIIDADAEGILYTPQEREKRIFQFFRDIILPIYEQKQLIEDKIGPSYNEGIEALKNTDYHGFISASTARGISFGELLRSVGLSPCVSLNQEVGTAFHWIAEYNFMMQTRVDNDCISYYESSIHDDDEYRPDNTILINKNFRDLSIEAKRVSENIEWINLDYYLFHSTKRGFNYKTDKGYQSESSLLILAPLNIKSNIIIPPENVKFLSPFNFCKFFGFSNKRTKEFIDFARLALQATNSDNTEALDKLLQEAKRCKNELTSNPNINFKKEKK
ncbi:MAG: hypothetical protein KGD63_15715 [Candidatus Lokiarchaeota archaeon]|nr:hypothetical protein [Candidatus Lokiarchaeota archaeon]